MGLGKNPRVSEVDALDSRFVVVYDARICHMFGDIFQCLSCDSEVREYARA